MKFETLSRIIEISPSEVQSIRIVEKFDGENVEYTASIETRRGIFSTTRPTFREADGTIEGFRSTGFTVEEVYLQDLTPDQAMLISFDLDKE